MIEGRAMIKLLPFPDLKPGGVTYVTPLDYPALVTYPSVDWLAERCSVVVEEFWDGGIGEGILS
jgi:hypothetical protein